MTAKVKEYIQPYIREHDGTLHLGFDILADWQCEAKKGTDLDFANQLAWLAARFAQHFLDYALKPAKDRVPTIDSRKQDAGAKGANTKTSN